LEDAAPSLGK